ncbi:hypothetical protein [Streptomyces roseus]|uniref:HIT domain-containing protein n=1 Tax=Streptomyces roseus TaxID=66430 RepID=A0A0J6XMU1_9ACTN|nr:hypothetical protein [Streptomyces roseus]KMO96013.1 hypothetical protein ACS04_20150 [Streptomyces roseus]
MDDCQFCIEFTAREAKTRIITETADSWVLLPTVGCLTPGYSLYMPLDHLDAAADVAPDDLPQVVAGLESMRTLIQDQYGPTIVAEHGPRDCELGASCCSHAHLHLIPVPEPDAILAAYEKVGGPGRRLSSLVDLPAAAETSYLYLSPRPGEHHYWPTDDRFARQFVRRVVADHLGIGEQYDWRDHPFTETRQQTYDTLTSAIRATTTA